MKKLMLLVVMLAMVVMLVAAAPAMAQDAKAAKAQAKAAKQKQKAMPKTGGAPINAALLGLGGATIIVGGGLLVRRVTR